MECVWPQSQQHLSQEILTIMHISAVLRFDDNLRDLKNKRNKEMRGSSRWKSLNAEFRRALRQASRQSWIETQNSFLIDKSGSGLWKLLRRTSQPNKSSDRIYDRDRVAVEFSTYHHIDSDLERSALDVDPSVLELLKSPCVIDGVTSMDVSEVL